MNDGPDLQTLLALFPPADYLQSWEVIPGDQVPQPYHHLLVHDYHMTVTVEAHHGSLVDVKVLDKKRAADSYARKILLARQSDGRIVMFGLVRIWLHYCSPEVQAEILAEKTPIGRVLINHEVLRRIKPTEFLRIKPGPDMMKWFGLVTPEITYGRLALIHCDDQPAVEVLEIVAPAGALPTEAGTPVTRP